MTSAYRFHCPVKIISGEAALDKLPGEFLRQGAKSPIIVTDQGVVQAGLLKVIEKVFDDSDISIGVVYDQVPPDSPVSSIHEIVDQYHRNNCDSLLAVGGGSAIDTAKAANIKITDESIDLTNFKAVLKMRKPTRPLVVVPTTAGTGSEVTSASVISVPEKGVKISLLSPKIPANTAIIDPRMTATLPPMYTAATGMDALVHAVEAAIGIQKNPISDSFAASAISLISKNLLEVVKNGSNMQARLAMANAATMAGVAFSNSMVGMVHALGHTVGAMCHVPHGTAMSLFLPDTLEYSLDTIENILAELLLPMVGPEEFVDTPQNQRATRFIESVRELRQAISESSGLPQTLKEAGISEDKLEELAKATLLDPAVLFNRKKVDEEGALHVLRKAYQ